VAIEGSRVGPYGGKGRGAPYVAAVMAAEEEEAPRWIRPLSDYERKETTVVEGLRYG
jgi:hypothetical protein